MNLTSISVENEDDPNQCVLDINQVRILPMSHKFDLKNVYSGLLIHSVDGETDFVLNDAMLRVKAGDVLIHKTHYALTGQEEVYRELIRTLFGTHRVNLVGLVFSFSPNGEISKCFKWKPNLGSHIGYAHPTERKIVEIIIMSLYMNESWLSMPVASRVDLEDLSQSTKQAYILKLSKIEDYLEKIQKSRKSSGLSLSNLLHFHHQSSDDFRSFEWTPSRIELFDSTVRSLLDRFYNMIQDIFQDEEFDRDQYAYINDNVQNMAAAFVNNAYESRFNPYNEMPQTYF